MSDTGKPGGTGSGQGRTAEVFDLGDGRVLKLFRPGFPLRAVERERLIAEALSKHGEVPCPRFLGPMERDGRPGLVYERIEGPSQLDTIAANPLLLGRQARLAASLHARVHRLRLPGSPLPEQREALAAALARAELQEPLLRAMIERVRSWPAADLLCHGDFHPDNILLSPRGPVIIDWMTATRGRPLVDVARTAVIMRFSAAPPHLPHAARLALEAVKRLYLRIYLRAYATASGEGLSALGELMVPIAAARIAEDGPPEEKRRLLAFVRASLRER